MNNLLDMDRNRDINPRNAKLNSVYLIVALGLTIMVSSSCVQKTNNSFLNRASDLEVIMTELGKMTTVNSDSGLCNECIRTWLDMGFVDTLWMALSSQFTSPKIKILVENGRPSWRYPNYSLRGILEDRGTFYMFNASIDISDIEPNVSYIQIPDTSVVKLFSTLEKTFNIFEFKSYLSSDLVNHPQCEIINLKFNERRNTIVSTAKSSTAWVTNKIDLPLSDHMSLLLYLDSALNIK